MTQPEQRPECGADGPEGLKCRRTTPHTVSWHMAKVDGVTSMWPTADGPCEWAETTTMGDRAAGIRTFLPGRPIAPEFNAKPAIVREIRKIASEALGFDDAGDWYEALKTIIEECDRA